MPLYELLDRKLEEIEDMKIKIQNFKQSVKEFHGNHLSILSNYYSCEMDGRRFCENNKEVLIRRQYSMM